MSRRPKASKLFLYSCLIVPVTFYVGYVVRGRRITSSEDSDKRPLALVAAKTPPQEITKRLREEEKFLEEKTLDIERKIAELQLRARKPQD